MPNGYSKTSAQRLSTCHNDLQLIFNEVIKCSPIDLGIAQGERTIELQQQYYNEGKSKINPKKYATVEQLLKVAKHIVDGVIRKKAMAVDIYAYIKGKGASWDKAHLCLIAGVVYTVSNKLFKEGKITHKIRWGGNWDGDGEIISDQSFQDLPHFELIK